MAWRAYKIVLRLRSPLHIGCGKVGNLQRTRPYVAGRNLWGALTARLTRDGHPQGKPEPEAYTDMGRRVHRELAFTYLFATTHPDGAIETWPWDKNFRYRFLSTYAGTALNYSAASAEEASLHEVECITSHTRDKGKQVYLSGYLFQREDSNLKWEAALQRLQIGGERGYGWGRVTVAEITKIRSHPVKLFDTNHKAHLTGEAVRINLVENHPLLAHALAAEFVVEEREGNAAEVLERYPAVSVEIHGPVEPLVGRETTPQSRFGVHVSPARICYAPGASVKTDGRAVIGPYGVLVGSSLSQVVK